MNAALRGAKSNLRAAHRILVSLEMKRNTRLEAVLERNAAVNSLVPLDAYVVKRFFWPLSNAVDSRGKRYLIARNGRVVAALESPKGVQV